MNRQNYRYHYFCLAGLLLLVLPVRSTRAQTGGNHPARVEVEVGADTEFEFRPTHPSYVPPAVSRLRADVSYLADDLREGRGPGTQGIDDAADHIAAVFREAGISAAPGAEGYFQPFSIQSGRTLGDNIKLSFTIPPDQIPDDVKKQLSDDLKKHSVPTPEGDSKSAELKKPSLVVSDVVLGPFAMVVAELKKNFSPLAIGSSGSFEDADVVFAGFGITADDDEHNLHYDDYKGLDVRDKVVLILRKEPDPKDMESGFSGEEPTSHATFRSKVANAARHHAKAVLLVNDSESAGKEDTLLDFDATPSGGTVPFLMVKRELADSLLSAAEMPGLDALETKINETLEPQSKPLEGVTASGSVSVERKETAVKNVVGVIEGEGPLADETVVVGAHYDHLGLGGSGSLAFGSHDIHNGADDNASGTSVVLEMARRLARRADPLPRRVVFILFSAEERGLLGSEYYVGHPLYPLEKTVAMVNFDMVGRLNKDRELTVFGARTSEGLDDLVLALAHSQGLEANLIEGTGGEFFASDHASFYKKDIPVLFFFTGTHADYHRPSDDAEKINYEGMARIADLGELVLLDLARRPARPEFIRLASPRRSSAPTRGGHGIYFGSRPNYAYQGDGVKLDGVSPDSPAARAGLQAGDIVVSFGGLDVHDLESYMTAMSGKKPGDEVEVTVERDGQEKTFKATLAERPSSRDRD